MEINHPKPIGGRRIPRPQKVLACPQCGEAVGTNYHDCAHCHEAIESIWLADWEALLLEEEVAAGSEDERMLARVVTADTGGERPPGHSSGFWAHARDGMALDIGLQGWRLGGEGRVAARESGLAPTGAGRRTGGSGGAAC